VGGADDRRFVRRSSEFRSNGKIIEGNLNKYLDWSPERLKNAIDQDDLYVEMTFAEVMDKVGLEATTEQYGEMFKNSMYELWHANAGARRNLNRGIKARCRVIRNTTSTRTTSISRSNRISSAL